jgi:hypothetical protein
VQSSDGFTYRVVGGLRHDFHQVSDRSRVIGSVAHQTSLTALHDVRYRECGDRAWMSESGRLPTVRF